MSKAADACARMVADMESGREPYWLTLAGKQGCGKTMLARQVFTQAARANPGNPANNAIWPPNWFEQRQSGENRYSSQRPACLWFSANGFKDRMLGGDYELPEALRDDFFVAIDDVGAANDTRNNALADGLYRLADQRAHKWMVWTTNLSLQEIHDRLDPRISSRLIRDQNKLINITACDYALRSRRVA